MKSIKSPWSIFLCVAILAASCISEDADPPANPEWFKKIYVSGICPLTSDLGEVELSLTLYNGVSFEPEAEIQLLPQTRLVEESEPVGELFDANSILFSLPDTIEGEEPVSGEGEEDSSIAGVTLEVDAVSFDDNGGAQRRNDPRLLMLLLDQSGTLIGRDPSNPQVPPDTSRASDRKDERLTFFRQFVRDISSNVQVSLIPFSGNSAKLENAAPNAKRSQLDLQLSELARAEEGGTPLNDALDHALSLADQESNRAVPSILLFTDGLEDGDSSEDGSPAFFQQLIAQYAEAGFPVTVIHLQPPVGVNEAWRGRSPDLAQLACETGGQYIFLERADLFSESTTGVRLEHILRSQLTGTWRVKARSNLNTPLFQSGQGIFLSTEVGVSLGSVTQLDPLYLAPEDNSQDRRLWIYKP